MLMFIRLPGIAHTTITLIISVMFAESYIPNTSPTSLSLPDVANANGEVLACEPFLEEGVFAFNIQTNALRIVLHTHQQYHVFVTRHKHARTTIGQTHRTVDGICPTMFSLCIGALCHNQPPLFLFRIADGRDGRDGRII